MNIQFLLHILLAILFSPFTVVLIITLGSFYYFVRKYLWSKLCFCVRGWIVFSVPSIIISVLIVISFWVAPGIFIKGINSWFLEKVLFSAPMFPLAATFLDLGMRGVPATLQETTIKLAIALLMMAFAYSLIGLFTGYIYGIISYQYRRVFIICCIFALILFSLIPILE